MLRVLMTGLDIEIIHEKKYYLSEFHTVEIHFHTDAHIKRNKPDYVIYADVS